MKKTLASPQGRIILPYFNFLQLSRFQFWIGLFSQPSSKTVGLATFQVYLETLQRSVFGHPGYHYLDHNKLLCKIARTFTSPAVQVNFSSSRFGFIYSSTKTQYQIIFYINNFYYCACHSVFRCQMKGPCVLIVGIVE